jgi:hypothetical protein
MVAAAQLLCFRVLGVYYVTAELSQDSQDDVLTSSPKALCHCQLFVMLGKQAKPAWRQRV